MAISGEEKVNCSHCWHVHRGPMAVCLRDGYVVQICCKCGVHRELHADHVFDEKHGRYA